MSEFLAIDVETANADLASICQIGIISFHDGKVVDRWETFVDPEDYFDEVNISIHGIDEHAVAGAPTFVQISEELRTRLTGKIVVHHTHFDRVSIVYSLADNDLPSIECTWLDTARVARRAWPQFATSGYGLANVAEFLGISFQHHNAAEDARAAGEILLHAIRQVGLLPEEWLIRVNKPVGSQSYSIERDGNQSGALYGEVIVFTGALFMPRKQAADLAALAGCNVDDGVTKQTTLLVIGDQDSYKLAGYEKSKKHRKAEALILKGQPIRILSESDFVRMFVK